MKRLLLLLATIFATIVLSAQVKIGSNPTTIGTSSLLELESPNKALKLTGVHDTSRSYITNPVNGMMVYDSSRQCVIVFQNGAWSGCAGADSKVSPVLANVATQLRFKDFFVDVNPYPVCYGIATDGKLYGWGGYSTSNFTVKFLPGVATGTTQMFSPMRLQAGLQNLTFSKVRTGYGGDAVILGTDSNLYLINPLSGLLYTQITAANFTSLGNTSAGAAVYKMIAPPDGTKWVDFDVSISSSVQGGFVGITSGGNAYFSGPGSGWLANGLYKVLSPNGASAGFKYGKVWAVQGENITIGSYTPFALEGLDGGTYSYYTIYTHNGGPTSSSPSYLCGCTSGTTGQAISGYPNASNTGNIFKIQFPAGKRVQYISGSGGYDYTSAYALAIFTDGTAAFWGRYNNATTVAASTFKYAVLQNEANTNLKAIGGFLNQTIPDMVVLPTLNGDSKFTSVLAGASHAYLCTDKGLYEIGNFNGTFIDGAGNFALLTNSNSSSSNTPQTTYYPITTYKGYQTNRIYGNSTSYFYTLDAAGRVLFVGNNTTYSGSVNGQVGSNIIVPQDLLNGSIDPYNPFPL